MSAVAQQLFNAIQSHALASGLFAAVNTVEPKSTPGSGLTCAIWIQTIDPVPEASGLNQTAGRIEFSVRLYTSMLAEPDSGIDPALTRAALTLMGDFSGDFGLSIVTAENVQMIDLLGAHGNPLRSEAGYLTVDQSLYRVLTITLPVIVNDLWAQAV